MLKMYDCGASQTRITSYKSQRIMYRAQDVYINGHQSMIAKDTETVYQYTSMSLLVIIIIVGGRAFLIAVGHWLDYGFGRLYQVLVIGNPFSPLRQLASYSYQLVPTRAK